MRVSTDILLFLYLLIIYITLPMLQIAEGITQTTFSHRRKISTTVCPSVLLIILN